MNINNNSMARDRDNFGRSTCSVIVWSITMFLCGVSIGRGSNLEKTPAPESITILGSNLVKADDNKNAKNDILPVALNKHNGFHPIYVYYGKEGSVRTLPKMTKKYRPGSQVFQDQIIAALVSLYRSAVGITDPAPYFIDLAANDAVELSNSLLLEDRGFNGLCVEPNPAYWYRLAHRQCAVAGTFVSKVDLEEIDVSLSNLAMGGMVADGFDNARTKLQLEKRHTISVKTLLEQFNVPEVVDYLSLDVEGAEEMVMNSFPFDDYLIRFMTIERPKDGLKTLLKEKGYTYVAPLSGFGETLWVHESVLLSNGLTRTEIEGVVSGLSNYAKQNSKKFWNSTTKW